MKITIAMTLFLALLATAQDSKETKKAPEPQSPEMTDQDRARVRLLLQTSEKEFLDAVEKLTDEQWSFKPAPVNGRERWSIAECAQHIVLAEGAIFSQVQAAMAAPAVPDWEAKTDKKTLLLMKTLPDRSHQATAPEAIQPKMNWTRAETMSRFKEARAKTIKFAETTDLPLKEHTKDNPFPVFGTLNAYQWLLYVPLHNMRHNQQIAEVKTYPGYPK
jgi:uncharacterized damage-inducible protein DinB